MELKDIRNYSVRQRNWVKANNLKPGDKVMIINIHDSYSKGWFMPWIPQIAEHLWKIVEVKDINPTMGVELVIKEEYKGCKTNAFVFVPYTVLQKVEERY